MAGVVKLGVWVMDFEWAIQSLVAERKLPELGQHVPGGAPVLLGEEDTNVQRLSNDEIADVLKSEGRYAYKGKEKVNSLAERLAHKVSGSKGQADFSTPCTMLHSGEGVIISGATLRGGSKIDHSRISVRVNWISRWNGWRRSSR